MNLDEYNNVQREANEYFTLTDCAYLVDKYGLEYVLGNVLMLIKSPEDAVLLHKLMRRIDQCKATMYNVPKTTQE